MAPKKFTEMGITEDGHDWYRCNPDVKEGHFRFQGKDYDKQTLDVAAILTMPGSMDAVDKALEALDGKDETKEPEPQAEEVLDAKDEKAEDGRR